MDVFAFTARNRQQDREDDHMGRMKSGNVRAAEESRDHANQDTGHVTNPLMSKQTTQPGPVEPEGLGETSTNEECLACQ